MPPTPHGVSLGGPLRGLVKLAPYNRAEEAPRYGYDDDLPDGNTGPGAIFRHLSISQGEVGR